VSLAYTFDDARAAGRKQTQYFENNGSRGIYHDGWFAGTFGPLIPWDTPGSVPRLKSWVPDQDVWELYDLSRDFSQADDLAAREPRRLEELKKRFMVEAEANKVLPIGGGLWTRLHPEDVTSSPYRTWRFDATTTRMPEFSAPPVGKRPNQVTIDLDMPGAASGVLYAMGGISGGVVLYLDHGKLVYEYNMLAIERKRAVTAEPLPPGPHTVRVREAIARPGAAAEVIVEADGREALRLSVPRTVPGAFTASESFDVGVDLGSPVSLDYFDKAPFRFEGSIRSVRVDLQQR
jgi:hypothetical protein